MLGFFPCCTPGFLQPHSWSGDVTPEQPLVTPRGATSPAPCPSPTTCRLVPTPFVISRRCCHPSASSALPLRPKITSSSRPDSPLRSDPEQINACFNLTTVPHLHVRLIRLRFFPPFWIMSSLFHNVASLFQTRLWFLMGNLLIFYKTEMIKNTQRENFRWESKADPMEQVLCPRPS